METPTKIRTNKEIKLCIKESYDEFVNALEPKGHLLNRLLEEQIIAEWQKEEISNYRDREERVDQLFLILFSSLNPAAFTTFREILQELKEDYGNLILVIDVDHVQEDDSTDCRRLDQTKGNDDDHPDEPDAGNFETPDGHDVYFVNHWKRIHKLGEGGFGCVYLCRDTDTNRMLAAKVIKLKSLANKEQEVRALKEEIGIYERIKHERIIDYYGCDERNGELTIFMEHAEGGSIGALIKERQRPLSEKTAQKYTRQILEGLRYLHEKRIAHRDLKGDNVLLDKYDNIKLCDFGCSRRIDYLYVSKIMTEVIGTSCYMSPEMVKHGNYGRRTDIWSLGCTVVEMLTRNPPWALTCQSAAQVHVKISECVTHDGRCKHPDYALPSGTSQAAKDFLNKCFVLYDLRPTCDVLLTELFVRNVYIVNICI